MSEIHKAPKAKRTRRLFMAELSRESDASVVTRMVSRLDELLGELLQAAFIVDGKESARLLQSGPRSPLGSLSSRASACYCLALIPKWVFEHLEIMRKIRNDFAHTTRRQRFSDPPVCDHCQGLISLVRIAMTRAGKPHVPDPRFDFEVSAFEVQCLLEHCIQRVRRMEWVPMGGSDAARLTPEALETWKGRLERHPQDHEPIRSWYSNNEHGRDEMENPPPKRKRAPRPARKVKRNG